MSKDYTYREVIETERKVPADYVQRKAADRIAPKLFGLLLNEGPHVVELESSTREGWGPRGHETEHDYRLRLTRARTHEVYLPAVVAEPVPVRTKKKKPKPAPPRPWYERAAAWIADEWKRAGTDYGV